MPGYGPPPAKVSSSPQENQPIDEDDDEEDDDEEEEIIQAPAPPLKGFGKIKALIAETPRKTLMAAGGLFLAGLMIGGTLAWFVSQREVLRLSDEITAIGMEKTSSQARRLAQLKRERSRLNEDIMRATVTGQTYPDNSIPKALAQAALEEYKITDALLQQQIAALETGARVTVEVKQTNTDPSLAASLEREMNGLRDTIEELRAEAQSLSDVPRLVAETAVATELINLAILNRNRLIAKYGLSSPIPSQYGGGQVSENTVVRDDETKAAALAVEEELRSEIARLKAQNESLQKTESILYASAVNDFEAGKLIGAENKFQELIRLFPKGTLAPEAKEGLARVKEEFVAREAAKVLPVDLSMAALRHDGGYLRNETYVRISFKNTSSLMIKKLEFKILTFDEHGYPIPSKRMAVIKDNDLTAIMSENIPPGKSDYGMWELSEKVRQVKVKLQKVEFYDTDPWHDADIEAWVARESGRYALDRVAAKI